MLVRVVILLLSLLGNIAIASAEDPPSYLEVPHCYRFYRADDERYGSSCETGYRARERAFKDLDDDPLYCQSDYKADQYSDCQDTTLKVPVDWQSNDTETGEVVLNISLIDDTALASFLEDEYSGDFVSLEAKCNAPAHRFCGDGRCERFDQMVFSLTKCYHLALYPGICDSGPPKPPQFAPYRTDEFRCRQTNKYGNSS